MEKLKKALDWDKFGEPRRTQIYRLLNAASWIACGEMGEAINSIIPFLADLKREQPEWSENIEQLYWNKIS